MSAQEAHLSKVEPRQSQSNEEIAFLSAVELVDHYRSKKLSPVEVTQAILNRIDRLDPHIRSYALVDAEHALAAARQSEQRWLRGEPLGIVDGVPAALKDLILAKGWPTLRGSRAVNPDQEWSEDSPAAARLREQGAILLGKTTTSEFGWKALGDSPVTGTTRNPWNLAHTPGGSSGGSAAAATAGFGPLHVATDGAGSTRLPAAHTGTFGFKPTFGRVPVYPTSQNGTLFHVAPLTRTVRDAALLLDVISRPDGRDWTALPFEPIAWGADLEKGIKGFRIAFSPTLGYAKVDPQVEKVVADAVRVFADLGATVELVDPGIEDPASIHQIFWFTGAAKLIASLGDRATFTEPGLQAIAEQGRKVDILSYLQAVDRREALGRHFNRFHQDWDLLITPATAFPASAIDAAEEDRVRNPIRSPFTYPFNLTQQPAASIPAGLTDAGLPIGLQIIGPKFSDTSVLRAARAFEEARPFGRPKDAA